VQAGIDRVAWAQKQGGWEISGRECYTRAVDWDSLCAQDDVGIQPGGAAGDSSTEQPSVSISGRPPCSGVTSCISSDRSSAEKQIGVVPLSEESQRNAQHILSGRGYGPGGQIRPNLLFGRRCQSCKVPYTVLFVAVDISLTGISRIIG